MSRANEDILLSDRERGEGFPGLVVTRTLLTLSPSERGEGFPGLVVTRTLLTLSPSEWSQELVATSPNTPPKKAESV